VDWKKLEYFCINRYMNETNEVSNVAPANEVNSGESVAQTENGGTDDEVLIVTETPQENSNQSTNEPAVNGTHETEAKPEGQLPESNPEPTPNEPPVEKPEFQNVAEFKTKSDETIKLSRTLLSSIPKKTETQQVETDTQLVEPEAQPAQPEPPPVETEEQPAESAEQPDPETAELIEQLNSLASLDLNPEVINQVNEQLEVINNLLNSQFAKEEPESIQQLNELKAELLGLKVLDFINNLNIQVAEALTTNPDLSPEQRVGEAVQKLADLVATGDPDTDAELLQLIKERLAGTDIEVSENVNDQTSEKKLDLIDDSLAKLEESESDPEKATQIKQVREILTLVGYGVLVGKMTAQTFFEKTNMDLKAFLSFIGNPTGVMGRGYESKSTQDGAEVIPHHQFKDLFKQSRDVGKALAIASEKLAERSENFRSWRNANETDLNNLKSEPNQNKTFELIISLNNAALVDSNPNSQVNWGEFSKEFASAMLNKNMSLEQDSVKFLKDLFKDGGKELKIYWNMSD
jgi:hypothetical protein